ncbi:hypothetical protein Pint_17832 [Pistacia integerrima]|uniref:Uncharacterized protein n=1 Tax=Pistacia integerrima TaxID=434235 RepID=A0ACC0YUZ0_9ROSI|nr:hypothetical protein Pint_17832 [Pistacia integerrima]
MGLSNFPSAAEGMLPVLVMNTVLSVALLKNMVRSVIQVMGGTWSNPSNLEDESSDGFSNFNSLENARERRISITQFKSLCIGRNNRNTSVGSSVTVDCCVCLNGFEADEEVSELACKHFFHKAAVTCCCRERSERMRESGAALLL